MNFDRKRYSDKTLTDLYKGLILPRVIEEKMLINLRMGKVTKWFSGIGQEAVSVGAAMALREDEFILPLHRNLGVFTSRKIPLSKLFAQFMGKQEGFTRGRDRSFHFGTLEHHIIGMISHLGPQMAVANGIGLAESLSGTKNVSLVFTGEGGASEGDFHEALNIAAVWDLPVIFLVENNGYGLSTPVSEQYRVKDFTEKGPAYGIKTVKVDGNNVLEVYDTIQNITRGMRQYPKPVLIEAETFRMRGHEEASGTDYVPAELFEKWAKKDPILNFERFLIKQKILNQEQMDEIIDVYKKEVDEAWSEAETFADPVISVNNELNDIFSHYNAKEVKPRTDKIEKNRFVDAISRGIDHGMEKHENLLIMGQDIAEYGGVFKVTKGLLEKYGKDRVRNTPLCESGVLGMAVGLSARGYKSIIELQFADFVTSGFNQVVNNIAKLHYRWGLAVDTVIRMPTGAGVGGGPFHSQSTEAWFFHVPGLKIVYPSSVHDAFGLLNSAIEDPNPVMYFEHKKLYRSLEEEIPEDYYTTPIGKARVVREGEDITIITYGLGVIWASEFAAETEDIDCHILDLRSLMPWDKEAVQEAVEKTGRVLVLNEDGQTGSISGEIASWIGENCFEHLDAPVSRLGSLDTPIPFNKKLENQYLASDRLKATVEKLANY